MGETDLILNDVAQTTVAAGATFVSDSGPALVSLSHAFSGENLLVSFGMEYVLEDTNTFVTDAGNSRVFGFTGSSAYISSTGEHFTGVPAFYICGTIGQFAVGAASATATSVRWCAIGDAQDWPTPGTADARAKQSGQEILDITLGKVTGIAGNEFFGYVFQEHGITKFTYVGGDVVFNVDVIERGRGCGNNNRLVQINEDTIFFESTWGYHKLQNNVVTDIGIDRVDETYPPVNVGDPKGPNYTTGTPQKSVVSNAALSTIFFSGQQLAYNYKTDQWSRIPAFGDSIIDDFFSYHEADKLFGQIHHLSTGFGLADGSGASAVTGTMTTGEFALNPGGRAVVDACRPLTDGGSLSSVTIGVRDLLSSAVAKATGTAINTRTGASNFRGGANTPEGRYHRAEFIFTGGFTTVSGAEFDFTPTGKV
jgi:hypothetical protein